LGGIDRGGPASGGPVDFPVCLPDRVIEIGEGRLHQAEVLGVEAAVGRGIRRDGGRVLGRGPGRGFRSAVHTAVHGAVQVRF